MWPQVRNSFETTALFYYLDLLQILISYFIESVLFEIPYYFFLKSVVSQYRFSSVELLAIQNFCRKSSLWKFLVSSLMHLPDFPYFVYLKLCGLHTLLKMVNSRRRLIRPPVNMPRRLWCSVTRSPGCSFISLLIKLVA